MKKLLAILISITLLLSVIVPSAVVVNAETTPTYYVDSVLGNDENDGLAIDTPLATIDKAQTLIAALDTETAGQDGTIIVIDTAEFDGGENHKGMITIKGYDADSELTFASKAITIGTGKTMSAVILCGPTAIDGVKIPNVTTSGNKCIATAGHKFVVENLPATKTYDGERIVYVGHVVDTFTSTRENVIINNFGGAYGTTNTVYLGALNNKNTTGAGLDLTINGGKVYNINFLKGTTYSGNVNVVLNKFDTRGDTKTRFYNDGSVFNGAFHLVINNGKFSNFIESGVNNMNAVTAAGGAWIIRGEKAADGSTLTTTDDAGKFKVNGGMVANAYKIVITSTEVDGTVTKTETVSEKAIKSKNGILDLSADPGIYKVVYTEPTAEENEDLEVYVTETGSDTNDGKTIDTAFATIDRAQNWLNMSSAEGEKIIYVKGTVDFDGGEPHTEMMTLKGYDDTAFLNFKSTNISISSGSLNACTLKGPTTFDGLQTLNQSNSTGYHYLVTGGQEFVIKNGKNTGWKSHNYYIGPVADTPTDKRSVVTIENGGGVYGTTVGFYFGALNNTNKSSAGVDFLMKNGRLYQVQFIKNTTFTGDVNLVFDNPDVRGDVSTFVFTDNGAIFEGALQVVFHNGKYANLTDASKTNLPKINAADGTWVIDAEKASDGSLLRTTADEGKFQIVGGMIAKAYKVTDGVVSETVSKTSANGILDLSAEPGTYKVKFFTPDAEVNNDTVVYVSETGSNLNDGKTIDTAFGSIEFAEKWLNASTAEGDKTIVIVGTVDFRATIAHEDMFIYKAYDSATRLTRYNTTWSDEIYGLQELKGPTTFQDITFVNGDLPIYSNGYPLIIKAAPDKFAVWVGNYGKGNGLANRESFVYDSVWDYWDNMTIRVGGNGSKAKTVNGADVHLVKGELNTFGFGKNNTFTDDVNIVFDGIRRRGDNYGGYINAGSGNTFEKALQVVFNNGQIGWIKDDANKANLESIKANGGTWILYAETATDGTVLGTTDTAGKFEVKGESYAKATNTETGAVIYSKNGFLTVDAGIYTVTYQKTLLPEEDRPFDVTGDDKIDATDLTTIVKAILKSVDISIFDVNEDGASDIRDLVAIKEKLAAPDFLESGLANTYRLLKNEKKLTIGYIGGSITYGDSAKSVIENGTVVSKDGDINNSYVNRVSNWFKEEYPNATIETVNAGVSNTHSYLGLYRLEETLMNTEGHDMPDLVFIEYTTNDWTSFGVENVKTFVESLVLNIRSINPYADIVILSTNISGTNSAIVNAHKEVADHYGISFIDVGTPLRQAMIAATGKGSEAAGEYLYTADNLHPSALGYGVYFDAIRPVLENELISVSKDMYNHAENGIPALCENLVLDPVIYDATNAEYSEDYTTTTISVSMHNTNLVELPNIPVTTAGIRVPKDGTVTATFDGDYVGILAVVNDQGLPLQYQIDGGEWKAFDITNHRYYHTNAFMLESGLGDGEHTITIKVLRDTSMAILG